MSTLRAMLQNTRYAERGLCRETTLITSGMERAEQEQVEVYSRDTNAWIVRTPGRQYPALVVQGDSFSTFVALAESILARARACGCADTELVEEAEELRELLSARLSHYATALGRYGFDVPFGRGAPPT